MFNQEDLVLSPRFNLESIMNTYKIFIRLQLKSCSSNKVGGDLIITSGDENMFK